jgi:hypothetical protein
MKDMQLGMDLAVSFEKVRDHKTVSSFRRDSAVPGCKPIARALP